MNGFEEIEWMQMLRILVQLFEMTIIRLIRQGTYLYKVMYLTYVHVCTDPRCPSNEVIM